MRLTCETYCNRAFGCSYYKKGNNYDKFIRNGLKRILAQYKTDSKNCNNSSLFSILAGQHNPRYFTRIVYKEDRKNVEDIFIQCIKNLDSFLEKYEVITLDSEYIYRSRVKGDIGAVIKIDGKIYNVDFSYRNSKDTFYNLFYHGFNSYLYNVINGTKNDLIVYMLRTNTCYTMKYKDYTIKHGFLRGTINRKTYRPGHQCLTCNVRECTPRLVTSLERI